MISSFVQSGASSGLVMNLPSAVYLVFLGGEGKEMDMETEIGVANSMVGGLCEYISFFKQCPPTHLFFADKKDVRGEGELCGEKWLNFGIRVVMETG